MNKRKYLLPIVMILFAIASFVMPAFIAPAEAADGYLDVCPLCGQQLKQGIDSYPYTWESRTGYEFCKSFYQCSKCGFSNAIDENGTVILDFNICYWNLNNFKMFNGTTLVPDYESFKKSLPEINKPDKFSW